MVTAVRPLESVVLDTLPGLPPFSNLAAAAALASAAATWRACLRSALLADAVEVEDFRFA